MPQVKCPRCGTLVTYADGFSPVCPSCGFSGSLPGTAAAAPGHLSPLPPPPPAGPAPPTQAIAIVALVLNVVVWPGLGSLVAGRIGEGLAQGLLFLMGLLLTVMIIFFFIGIPLMVGMWVWGLVTGIQLIAASNRAAAPRPAA